MNPEQVIQSWLYYYRSKIDRDRTFLPGVFDDGRNPFDGTNYIMQEVDEKLAINSQEPILVFQNIENCSKKPFKVYNGDPHLLVRNMSYHSFDDNLEGERWASREKWFRTVFNRGPSVPIPSDSDTGAIYYRFISWKQKPLNWTSFPEELI